MTDEFNKVYCRMLEKYGLQVPQTPRRRSYRYGGRLSVAEVVTIMIMLHAYGYRCLKHFYQNEVCSHLRDCLLLTEV